MREDIRDGLRILADYENFHPLTHKHTAGVRALQVHFIILLLTWLFVSLFHHM